MPTARSNPRAFDLSRVPPLDARSHVPLYAQLADRFEALITRSPKAAVGKALPSESECVKHFKISRPTVRQAMGHLLTQGLITRGRGRGTFIAPPRVEYDLGRSIEAEIRSDNRTVKFRLLEWRTMTPPAHVAKVLRLRGKEKVERIVRLRLLNDKPFAFEERYFPSRYRKHITEQLLSSKLGISLIKVIAEQSPAKVDFKLRSIAADADVAEVLSIEQGAPLLSSQHTYWLEQGRPVLFGTVCFLGDSYEFSFRARIQVP